jgi:acyl-CoA thioester hydrolase
MSSRTPTPAHRFPVRVYYEDTDAAGLVYHSNYLKFAERARTEMLRSLGFGQRTLKETDGVMFAVRRCVIDYRRPALLDDVLAVATQVTEIGGASVEVEQVIERDDETVAQLNLTLACITPSGRPTRLPRALRAAFASYSS